VPLSCFHSQPCSIAWSSRAPNCGPEAFSLDKRVVDLLDMDAAVFAGRKFDQLAARGFWVSEGPFSGEFHRQPVAGTVGIFQSRCGRTSAPRLPQAWQVKRDSRSDSRTSSDLCSAWGSHHSNSTKSIVWSGPDDADGGHSSVSIHIYEYERRKLRLKFILVERYDWLGRQFVKIDLLAGGGRNQGQ
jgi:hypothetical protein